MVRLRKLVFFLSTAIILYAFMPLPAAHAGIFDRIKDIYNTPEKIDQLEQQYLDAKQNLEDALNATELLTKQQQELMDQNELYKKQNEQLSAQNAALLDELEQAKQQRESMINKLISTAVIIIVAIAAYFAALRIWRYMTWRRHGQSTGRGLN